ncbi:MAG TPA: hypothetical protein VIS72_06475, partial [Anaerolineales bacterium]
TTLASTDSVTFTAILSKNAKKKKEIVGLVVHAFGTLIKIADFKKALPPAGRASFFAFVWASLARWLRAGTIVSPALSC